MAKDTKYIRKRKRKYGFSYLIDIPYVDENGVQKHYTATVKIPEYPNEKTALLAAQKIRNDALLNIQNGKLKKIVPTVENLFKKKFELMPQSVRTQRNQQVIFDCAFDGVADKRLSEITSADIQTTINRYAETHTQNCVSRALSIWRQIYAVSSILGYDISDKTKGVIIPKSRIVKTRRNVNVNISDFHKVLDAVLIASGSEYNNRTIWFLLQIMYFTGCRPAEALSLTADDIQHDYISITKSVGSTPQAEIAIVPPKTESSRRNIPIAPDLRPILDDLLRWSKNEFLLADEDGNLQSMTDISHRIRAITRPLKVHFNSYMLRHLMSSDLLHNGDSVIARDLLGHTSFSMTLDYARSTDQQILSAISNLRAEKQPKKKSHEPPPDAAFRLYLIYRIAGNVRFCAILKRSRIG